MTTDDWRAAKQGQHWSLLVNGVWHETRYQHGGDGVPSYFWGDGFDLVPMYPSEAASIQDAKRHRIRRDRDND